MISHRLKTVQNADIIYVFHQGKIVEQGTLPKICSPAGDWFQKATTQILFSD